MNDSPNRDVEIFTEALRLAEVEREAFLELACGNDAELRRRVEALLDANERVGDFLEHSPQKFSRPPGEKPGDRIGHYKLLQQIGEGGCGVVFMAEQEEPVRRLVALKIIKPGMDTKSVIARFEAERQVLALMDHPSIAKVFDAGATDSGRPYFVMELIRGAKISEYCDQHSLTTQDRLTLFAQVCEAVQHAHQKGIIHRDIKPSNILVTKTEQGASLPVVIDFGIAKATTNQQLTDKTLFTAFELLIGTPAYMSPEQAALSSGVDVDTRTDVYSLGVLLYELLTGLTPFDAPELLKAGLDEIRRVIREVEPARPSTRLSTMTAADLTIEAQHRRTNAPTLIRAIRGDLDWIVMKAMEKDRTRRYATAHGLALDVERYLANEAVSACPPSAFYKFQKLVRRNRLLFVGMSLIVGLVFAGLVVVSISLAGERQALEEANLARLEADRQGKEAETGRQNALTEAARSREVTEIMKKMFAGVNPIVALGHDTSVLREILNQTVERINRELTNQPAVQADLKLTIGGVFGSLGEWDKEAPLIRDALAFYRKSPGGDERQLVDALREQALLDVWQGKLADAEREDREALAIETNLPGGATMRLVVLETQTAWVIVRQDGRAAEAEELFRKALATGQQLVGDDSEQLLDTRAGLATALNLQDRLAEAEPLLRDSITLGRKKLGADHPYVANDMYRLAFVLERAGHLQEAETLLRQCVDNRRRIFGTAHPLYDQALNLLAVVLDKEEKKTEAAEVCREQLAIRRKRYGDDDSRVAATVVNLSELLASSRDEVHFEQLAGEFPRAWLARAEQSARYGQWPDALAAASKYMEIRPREHEAYHVLAPVLVQTGDRAAYEQLCARITTLFAGARDPYVADRMAKDCLILPRPAADLKTVGELAETAVTLGNGDSGSLPYFQCCKALAEFRVGRYGDAVSWARRASSGPRPQSQAEAAAIIAMAQFKLDQIDDARTALADCNKVIKEKLPELAQGDLGADWRDWIIAHALSEEAERLITADKKADKNPPHE